MSSRAVLLAPWAPGDFAEHLSLFFCVRWKIYLRSGLGIFLLFCF